MSGINKFIGIGRLVKDAEVSRTSTGIDVAKFTIAIDRVKKQNEEKAKADFVQCVAWQGTATYIQKYVRKGDQVGVTGRYTTDNYKDKDGKTVYRTYITCEQIQKTSNSVVKAEPPKQSFEDEFDTGIPAIDEDMDLPF